MIFIYTSKHGGWLNMVEIELGALVRQYLNDSISDQETPGVEIQAWATDCKDKVVMADRCFRRYRRHWKVERLFARLRNYRCILVRYDRFFENYLAFVQFGLYRDFYPKLFLRCVLVITNDTA